MAYVDDAVLVRDGPFGERVRLAMVKTAQAVASEAVTAKPLVDSKRNTFAHQVLNNPDGHLQRFVLGAIVAGSLTGNSIDTALNSACASIWNGLATVTTADLA